MWKWVSSSPKAAIVIIHGALEHHGRYKWLIKKWQTNGYHVVMGDLPGQGNSSSRRGHVQSFDEYIDEVDRWIREAQSFQLPLFLLGHSMDGLIAIRTLQRNKIPLNGVILSSPCLGILQKPSKALDLLAKGLNIFAPRVRFDSGLTVEMATRNKEIQDINRNDSLYVRKVSVRWYRELLHAIELAFQQLPQFPDVPLFVMQGGEDKIVDKSAVQKWYSQLNLTEKSYKEWEGLYHEIFNEPERELVFQDALRFTESHLT
ncbi:alpha/beta hydrolase [Aeribacillus sp. FSL K6-1305]|uniref:alpha/beta hydrolase n=1 Tax=Aeribacillus sp. FSL K6-1305 TaxID=2954569 RepID=UPI0030FDB056